MHLAGNGREEPGSCGSDAAADLGGRRLIRAVEIMAGDRRPFSVHDLPFGTLKSGLPTAARVHRQHRIGHFELAVFGAIKAFSVAHFIERLTFAPADWASNGL